MFIQPAETLYAEVNVDAVEDTVEDGADGAILILVRHAHGNNWSLTSHNGNASELLKAVNHAAQLEYAAICLCT